MDCARVKREEEGLSMIDFQYEKEIKKLIDQCFNDVINCLNQLLKEGWEIRVQKYIKRKYRGKRRICLGWIDLDEKIIIIASVGNKNMPSTLLHEVLHYLYYIQKITKGDAPYELLELVVWKYLYEKQREILESYLKKSS